MFADSIFVDIWDSSYSDPLRLEEFEKTVKDRLVRHVRRLAEEIGERNNGRSTALEEAAQYVEAFDTNTTIVPWTPSTN